MINITLAGASKHHQEEDVASGDILCLPALALGMKQFTLQFPSQVSLISNRKLNGVDQHNLQVNDISFYQELFAQIYRLLLNIFSLQVLL